MIQALSLALFLVLLFSVCWPYSVQPAQTWHNWRPREVDVTTGRIRLEAGGPMPGHLKPDRVVYLGNELLQDDRNLGAFRIVGVGDRGLTLEPATALDEIQRQKLTRSTGPLSLGEKAPGSWPSHYADGLRFREKLPAELFLVLEPLVSLSTALATRAWVWSLAWAAAVLLVCLFIPRGFCGFVCPLGTLLDLFDWFLGRRVPWLRLAGEGWWQNLRYYLLAAVLGSSLAGVLFSGVVAAIPLLTRGLVFLVAPAQTGLLRGWHQVPPIQAGQVVSLVLFFLVLGLGLLRPRFWCQSLCPSGAVFSLANLLRLTQRTVDSRCVECGKCLEACSFAAIEPDFGSRFLNCASCRTCKAACPRGAIHFVGRWKKDGAGNGGATGADPGRRKFLHVTVRMAAAIAAGLGGGLVARAHGAGLAEQNGFRPVRPPGSVPEGEFLTLCVRCGECFRACPNDALQPLSFEQGVEGLWTPQLAPNWSGCETSCNLCGQVCPTGAIRALPLEEKRVARIGLAVVDQQTCLPYAGKENCQLCVEDCNKAGYHAIEFVRTGTEADELGRPVEGTGFLAPVVLADRCVGCGLCQTRCHAINVVQKKLLTVSAIQVVAGEGKEDRLRTGSYKDLREQEARRREEKRREQMQKSRGREEYLPDF